MWNYRQQTSIHYVMASLSDTGPTDSNVDVHNKEGTELQNEWLIIRLNRIKVLLTHNEVNLTHFKCGIES